MKTEFNFSIYTDEVKKLSSNKKLHILREWQRYLDEIAPLHSPFQQIIYMRLFWLSIGQNKKECRASYADLKKICNIKADSTFNNNIKELIKLRHVDILEKTFAVKTKYRVYSPLEILTPDKNDKKRSK
ncbi:MAG: hypothetical protein PHV68_08190 [Candidatus Gastranaerophilales bacterium]|nr:hypothetical protein [Candidatus Gastranaerophilales bacterium]